jgi:mycothiol synthase
MLTHTLETDTIMIPDAPPVPSLVFRRFRGEEDYAAMAAVIEGSKGTDGIERTSTVEDVARSYRHLTNCDPDQDVLMVEVEGQVAGYGRVWWEQQLDGIQLYSHFAFLLPAWRGTGIRRSMVHHNERRLRQIATGRPPADQRLFDAWAVETETDWNRLLLEEGYEPVRYEFDMVRPDLEAIPDLPLPQGIEVRPVQEDQHEAIWEASREAFRDHWGETEWQDVWLEELQESPTFNPALWQVAWDGDRVAGAVMTFIDAEENEEYGRQRGYTENIHVGRPWRRRGLARALMARSFRVLRDQGMTEAALGVDAQNPNGALKLYKSLGFRVMKTQTIYRKLLE